MNAIIRSQLLDNLEDEALLQMSTFLGAAKSSRGLLTSLAVLVAVSFIKSLDNITTDITEIRYNVDKMVDGLANISSNMIHQR